MTAGGGWGALTRGRHKGEQKAGPATEGGACHWQAPPDVGLQRRGCYSLLILR